MEELLKLLDLVRRELATQTDLDAVVIDLAGVGRLDYTGAAALGRLLAELRQADVEVRVENIPPGAARAAAIHLGDEADSGRA